MVLDLIAGPAAAIGGTSGSAPAGLRTEFPFVLPRGYVDESGTLHREGAMRLATARDEILPLRELERRAIQRALRATQGSVGKAAKLLGIGRATLYRRIATLDLSRDVA